MGKITMKAARVNANLTQREAATALGINKKTLGSWENGKTIPKADKIDSICSLYKVSYDMLIFLGSNNA